MKKMILTVLFLGFGFSVQASSTLGENSMTDCISSVQTGRSQAGVEVVQPVDSRPSTTNSSSR